MEQYLLPIFYLPPISWFKFFYNENLEIHLEQFENFPKQTYRNRANIYGANGKLSLIIPIHHSGKRVLKETEISYNEDWQKLHWKSIKTAYQSSPYFEYYEHLFQKIFSKKEKFLVDYNLFALEIVQQILKSEKAYSLNNAYEKNPKQKDLRDHFSAKQPSEIEFETYYQTFSDKLGFLPDLSIIDLLCNKGPETVTYIKNLKF